MVEAGDLLFEQDARFERIALTRAQAELEKAQAEHSKRDAGFLPQEIEEAQRGVAAAKSRSEAAKDEWERLRPLAENQVISESEASRAKSLYEVAAAELFRAEARLNIFQQGFRSEEVQIARAEVRVREAMVKEIESRLEDLAMGAPASGVIIAKHKEAGEWTSEGEPVVSMVVLDPIKIRAEVAQRHVSAMKPGQMARMTVDGLPDRSFEAEVQSVIPQANTGTRNFRSC